MLFHELTSILDKQKVFVAFATKYSLLLQEKGAEECLFRCGKGEFNIPRVKVTTQDAKHEQEEGFAAETIASEFHRVANNAYAEESRIEVAE